MSELLRFEDHPEHVDALIGAALAAADPAEAVVRHWTDELAGHAVRRAGVKLWVVSIGKASASTARALIEDCGVEVEGGVVVVVPGQEGSVGRAGEVLDVLVADHPIATERNLVAARAVEGVARKAAAGGSAGGLLCLVSGGASAHLVSPVAGVPFSELMALTRAMLRSGATIGELNAVRKHVESLKGGGLARLVTAREDGSATGAQCWSLILSDVIDDRIDTVGSGPTSADASTFSEALEAVERRGLVDVAPSITSMLRRGAGGELPETPKPGDASLGGVYNRLIGSNRMVVEAVRHAALRMGYGLAITRAGACGEAREAGASLAEYACEFSGHAQRPVCIAVGGETTVTVTGEGFGGRNTEMALSAALRLESLAQAGRRVGSIAIATFATDGVDGVSPPGKPAAAGAIVSAGTCARARDRGVDPVAMLADSDSYGFFDKVGGMIRRGPTGTNVNDVAFALVY